MGRAIRGSPRRPGRPRRRPPKRSPCSTRRCSPRLPTTGSRSTSRAATGAQSLWLAQRGMHVLAIDVSPIAIDLTRAAADEHDLAATDRGPRGHDLDAGLPDGRGRGSDGRSASDFVRRSLYPAIVDALGQGGIGDRDRAVRGRTRWHPWCVPCTAGELVDAFTSDKVDVLASSEPAASPRSSSAPLSSVASAVTRPATSAARSGSAADRAGDGRRQEVEQDLVEPVGRLDVWEVADTLDDLEPARRDRRVGGDAVLHRDDPVAVAPHDQGRARAAARYKRSLALTVWPPTSITPRIVRTNACRFDAPASELYPRHNSASFGEWTLWRPRNRPTSVARSTSGFGNANGMTYSAPGSANERSSQLTSPAQSAAADEHETVDEFRMLVGELHRHAAAEGMPDDGDAADVEHGEEVAQSAGERAERVVAHRLGRLAMAEQVGSDDVVSLGQRRHDVVPGARTARQPVDEQHDLALEPAALARPAFGWPDAAVAHRVTVDRHVLDRRPRTHALSIAAASVDPPDNVSISAADGSSDRRPTRGHRADRGCGSDGPWPAASS